jgi:hypothetical protein
MRDRLSLPRNYKPSETILTLYNGNGNDLDDEGGDTPRGHEFTEDQERQYRKLIREGMAPGWARKTVLASDHPLSCNPRPPIAATGGGSTHGYQKSIKRRAPS